MGEKHIDKEKLVTILEKSGIKKLSKLSEKCNLNKIADDTINVIKNEEILIINNVTIPSINSFDIFLIETLLFNNVNLNASAPINIRGIICPSEGSTL